MNATERTAIIRGIYTAIGMFAVTFLTTYATTDVLRDAFIVAGISALGILGFRSGAEGIYDGNRAANGNVQAGDVTRR